MFLLCSKLKKNAWDKHSSLFQLAAGVEEKSLRQP
jgi:hypothetical protein